MEHLATVGVSASVAGSAPVGVSASVAGSAPLAALPTLRRALAIALVALAGCGTAAVEKILNPSDVLAPEKTAVRTLMRASTRDGFKSEETPTGVVQDAVTDEVRITRLSERDVCFEVRFRTAISLDRPYGEWQFTVDDHPASLDHEVVTVRDYSASGDPPRTVLENVSQEGFAKRKIGEPKEILFRVVERRAAGCFPRALAAQKRVRLRVVLPSKDGAEVWRAAFEWRIVGE